MTVTEVLERTESLMVLHPGSQMVITGGEPLEQELTGLVDCFKSSGRFVAVETNGTRAQDLAVDWWAVSPKRERDYSIHPELVERVNEIKLVVTPTLTVEDVLEIRRKIRKAPIFLQPDVFTQGEAAYAQVFDLLERASGMGAENLRAGMQLHRIYRVP